MTICNTFFNSFWYADRSCFQSVVQLLQMYLFMPLLTHLLKVVLLLVLKKLFRGFFLTQKASTISMHIKAFLVAGFFFFFGGFVFCIKKFAYERFGTSKFLIAIAKLAIVDFHLIKLTILEKSESSRLEKNSKVVESNPLPTTTLSTRPSHQVPSSVISSRQGWWFHYLCELPIPKLDSPFSEEVFSDVQPELPLAQLDAIFFLSCHWLPGKKNPTLTWLQPFFRWL